MNKELTLELAEYVAKLLLYTNCDGEKTEKPAVISWEEVYDFSKMHSLASAVFSSVEDTVKAQCSPELVEKWELTRATDYAQHIKQSAEFSRITEALTEEKINFLPLKGFSYKSLWKDPAHRTMSDMDMYFHPDDFPRVDALLKSLGYAQDHECDVHVNYEKKPFVKIEAHRKFVENGPAIPFDTWEAKPDNPYFHVMNHEQLLTFGTEHAMKHYEHGGCGMRLVFDLYLYMKSFGHEIDRASLDKTLEENGLIDFFRLLCRLSDYWFGGSLADAETRKAAYYVATGGTYGSHDNSVSYGIEKKGKLGYVFARVFPPYRFMRLRYPILRKIPILLPFAYILRFFTSVFNGRSRLELRGMKKHKENERKENIK